MKSLRVTLFLNAPYLSLVVELRCAGVDNGCCTSDEPCGEGDGDCDNDSHCEGDLVCGTDNCPWGDGDDCCIPPGENNHFNVFCFFCFIF